MPKIDLAMWTFNGESTLSQVLQRINQVIPSECINKRLIIDDNSTDSTREIARFHGWQVFRNKGKGISDGANTALSYIKTEFFCTFEQDILLSPLWWSKIEPYIGKYDAVSGIRFSDKPSYVNHLQTYTYKKYLGENKLPAWLQSRKFSSFTLGKTLDNTLWRTSSLQKIGGFPNLKLNSGIDTFLAYQLYQERFTWFVDYTNKSIHLRPKGLKQELNHQYWYASTLPDLWKTMKKFGLPQHISWLEVCLRFIISIFTGFFVAIKTHDPNIVWLHPLIKLYYLRGLLHV